MTTQLISKCAIVYDINNLYKLLNQEGVTIFNGSLQRCKDEKDIIDKRDGYTNKEYKFELLKDFEGYKTGEVFDSLNGFTHGISSKKGLLRFDDKEWFKPLFKSTKKLVYRT